MTPGSLLGILNHGWVWLLVILGPLLFFNQRLHLELQAVLYGITRSQEISLAIFSILLFPGVFLHELSHWLAARLLGIRTGRFSLVPQILPGKKLRLGFVEMASTDSVREALVGAAPLLSGTCVVAYISLSHLGVGGLTNTLMYQGVSVFLQQLAALPGLPDFWIWFYLVFAVSSTMVPSPSDRRGWLPVGLVVVGLVGLALLAGAGPWAVEHFGPFLEQVTSGIATILGVCLAVQISLLLPLWMIRTAMSRGNLIRIASR